MSSALVHQLDSLGLWRQDLAEQCLSLRQFLRDHSVLDDSCGEWLDSLRRRLDSEKLRVAFVAEFSRGKSELINALFFASLGRRVMPATPGRTTMCPVELGYDPDQPPSLRLLPLATRKGDQSLSDLRQQPSVWRTIPLNVNDAEQLANDLLLVMDTQWVSPEEATELSDRVFQVRCAAEDVATAVAEGAGPAELGELCEVLLQAAKDADGWR